VEVRSQEEILATLDSNGTLENLPFMPEMLEFSGQRFEVCKRADKTCDPANGSALRRLNDTVHLKEVRCDGSAHGGCEASCLLFWREAWLKKVEGGERDADAAGPGGSSANEDRFGSQDPARSRRVGCTVERLLEGTRASLHGPEADYNDIFRCQVTETARFTSPLPWWDLRQYARDVASHNIPIGELLAGLAIGALQKVRHFFLGPRRRIMGTQVRTPSPRLGLRPGDLVEIKSLEEIAQTLDRNGKNRGMPFATVMSNYCGGRFRVRRRIKRIIDERSGKMIHMKEGCVALEGVVCRGHMKRFCPRGIYLYWREAWLRRIAVAEPQTNETEVTSPGAVLSESKY
jgi:hypothetical protein